MSMHLITNHRTWLVLGLLLWRATGGLAQLPDLSFERISAREGLPSNTVFYAAKDRKGFMWFGTRRGLTRYDGTSFRDFPDFETNPVLGLAVDSTNTLWAATDRKGIIRVDPADFRMTEVPPAHNKPSRQTAAFFIDSYGQGWYSDQYGVNRIDLSTGLSVHYPFRQTTFVWPKGSFLEDQQRNLWVVGSDNGLFRYDRQADTLRCVLGADAPDTSRQTPFLFSKGCVDAEGILWLGTYNYGLIRYDGQTGEYRIFPAGNSSNAVVSVAEGRDENNRPILWVGDTQGLGVFRPDQQQYYRFPDLIPDTYEVHYIFRDTVSGIVWVCTSAGILKYNPKSNLFRTIHLPAGLVRFPVHVNTFLADNTDPGGQTLWLGLSHTGMLRWNRQTNEFTLVPYPPANSRPDTRWMIQREDGTLWIGVNQWSYRRPGIYVYHPETGKFLQTPQSRAANTFFSVPFFMYGAFDPQERLWIGNSDEGFRILNAAGGVETAPDSSGQYTQLLKGNNLINDMLVDRKGRVWLGTYKGVYYLDQRHQQFVNTDSIQPAVLPEDPAVNSLYEDRQGNIWAARWGSVTKSAPDGRLLHVLTTRDGLYDRENRGLAEDASGNIWIGNYEGLHCYHPESGRLIRFTVNDGLLDNNTLGRVYVHAGNEVLIGQKNGINVFAMNKLKGPARPPGIEISSFRIHGREQFPDFSQPIRLKRSDNTFSVDFVALNYTKLHNNQYAYYLEGFDPEWNFSGTNHQAYYTNLDPGNYTLHLKAGDGLGNWNPESLALRISVLPAFYETWWFRAGIVILLAAVLYLIYRYRINQLLRLQRVRNRISADLHDEIGASLSGIGIMGTMARKNLQVSHPSAPFLERIVEETQQISTSLDDIVWSINPKNDEFTNLLARMTRYASELLEARSIAYTIKVPEPTEPVRLSMEQRRDFYLLFKEAVTNLVKHSRATQVSIEIHRQRHDLCLLIRDNGSGFEPAKDTERNGLRNMHKRAAALGGNLSLDSTPGTGTSIRLVFPA